MARIHHTDQMMYRVSVDAADTINVINLCYGRRTPARSPPPPRFNIIMPVQSAPGFTDFWDLL